MKSTNQFSMQRVVSAGALGGLIGGLAFGVWGAAAQNVLRPLLAPGSVGILNRIAGIVGSGSPLVGFGLHLVISIGIGAGFGLLVRERQLSPRAAALLGLAYGAVWLFLGNLILLPLMAREGFAGVAKGFAELFSVSTLLALTGHLIYGLVLGIVYRRLTIAKDAPQMAAAQTR